MSGDLPKTLQDGQHRPDPQERELAEKTIELSALVDDIKQMRERLILKSSAIFKRIRSGEKLKASERQKVEKLAKHFGKTPFGLTEAVRAAKEADLSPMLHAWIEATEARVTRGL